MQEFPEDYPGEATVTAYVPPSNPEGAFLIETSPSLICLSVAGFGLVLVLLGANRLRGG